MRAKTEARTRWSSPTTKLPPTRCPRAYLPSEAFAGSLSLGASTGWFASRCLSLALASSSGRPPPTSACYTLVTILTDEENRNLATDGSETFKLIRITPCHERRLHPCQHRSEKVSSSINPSETVAHRHRLTSSDIRVHPVLSHNHNIPGSATRSPRCT